MIENFEEITKDLSEVELYWVLLLVNVLNFEARVPMKSNDVCDRFNLRQAERISSGLVDKKYWGVKMSGVRLRKFVNHIRSNGLLPVIATSKGYYVSYDEEVIKSQIRSLEQRARSIQRCADGLKKRLFEINKQGVLNFGEKSNG